MSAAVLDWMQTYAPVLERLSNFKDYGNGRARACCPIHGDGPEGAEVWLAVGANSELILRCYPRKSGVPACRTDQLMSHVGLSLAYLFPDHPGTKGHRTPPPRQAAAGEPMANKKDKGRAVNEGLYRYEDIDAAGNWLTVYEVTKKRYSDGSKEFPQRRPNPDFDSSRPAGQGNEEWKYDLRGVRRVLYRMRELRAALADQPDRWVFIVEGEQDVETAIELGLTATCNSGGSCKWTEPYFKTELRNCNVVLIPDEDPLMPPGGNAAAPKPTWVSPGLEHIKQIGRDILPVVKNLRVLRFPSPKFAGYDLTDWKREQKHPPARVLEMLKAMVSSATPIRTAADLDKFVPYTYDPPSPPPPTVPPPARPNTPSPPPPAPPPVTTQQTQAPQAGREGSLMSQMDAEDAAKAAAKAGTPTATSPPPPKPEPTPQASQTVQTIEGSAVAQLAGILASMKRAGQGPRSIPEWVGELMRESWLFQAAVVNADVPANPATGREARHRALTLAAMLCRGCDELDGLGGGTGK